MGSKKGQGKQVKVHWSTDSYHDALAEKLKAKKYSSKSYVINLAIRTLAEKEGIR